jgi:hypothetical protein
MPIYRCTACGFIGEDQSAAAGTKLPCARCGTASALFATPFYVEKLVERYLGTRRELEALKAAMASPEEESSPPGTDSPAPNSLNLDELHNTALLATETQHRPLLDWFKALQIGATFSLEGVDTTGFFDEAARELGEHYPVLNGLMEQVRFAYRKDFSWINVDLAKRDPDTRQQLLMFARQMYGHTLFSRYSYKKQTQVLGLGMQSAPSVRNFFMGAWLEWYALTTLLHACIQGKREFSCARNVHLALQDGGARELDVAALVSGKLVVIECKTGEFRGELEKYVKLRQRLGVDPDRFIICNPDLPDEQAAGLGPMYSLTFVNMRSLRTHLERLI